jgi:hypothetical protein
MHVATLHEVLTGRDVQTYMSEECAAYRHEVISYVSKDEMR